MKVQTIIASVFAFAAGFGAYALLDAAWPSAPNTTAEHWRLVQDHLAYVRVIGGHHTGLSIVPSNGARAGRTGRRPA